MSAWAKPGAKCVCIGNDWRNISGNGLLPSISKGDVVTIRSVHIRRNRTYLNFMEARPVDVYSIEGFRPVAYPKQSLEHDIALFKRITEMVPG